VKPLHTHTLHIPPSFWWKKESRKTFSVTRISHLWDVVWRGIAFKVTQKVFSFYRHTLRLPHSHFKNEWIIHIYCTFLLLPRSISWLNQWLKRTFLAFRGWAAAVSLSVYFYLRHRNRWSHESVGIVCVKRADNFPLVSLSFKYRQTSLTSRSSLRESRSWEPAKLTLKSLDWFVWIICARRMKQNCHEMNCFRKCSPRLNDAPLEN
jgi:hypothetical protein